VSVNSVVDYYFLANDDCVLNGPAFSYSFYITAPALFGMAVALLVSSIYSKIGYSYTVRATAQLGVLLRIVGAVVGEIGPAIYINSDNRKIMFLIGVGGFGSAGAMLITLALTTHTAQILDRGKATAQFAILVSCANLGTSAAKVLGQTLIELFGVHARQGVACNFEYYVPMLALTRVVLPFGGIVLAYFLVPNIYKLK